MKTAYGMLWHGLALLAGMVVAIAAASADVWGMGWLWIPLAIVQFLAGGTLVGMSGQMAADERRGRCP